MDSTVKVSIPVRSARINATIIRCRCATSDSQAKHVAAGMPCPVGEKVEFGTISYYHRNPLRRLAWRIKNLRS